MATVEVKGFAKLDRALKELPLKVQNRIMGKVVRSGSKVVLKEAKALVPKHTGRLKKSMTIKRLRKSKTKGRIVDSVTFKEDGWYAHLIEFGHQLVKGGRLGGSGAGKVIGHIAAQPFLRPAFDKNKKRILDIMKKTFADELVKNKDNIKAK